MSLFGGKRAREEAERPGSAAPRGGATAPGPAPEKAPPEAVSTRAAAPPDGAPPSQAPRRGAEGKMAHIGKSISIQGDLTGKEDLVVEGQVEGKIELPDNELTIGAEGRVRAEVRAKTVIVVGHVAGNVSATERLEVQGDGVVDGDVRAPRLIVQEGAVVNGTIEMSKPGDGASAKPPAAPKPQQQPASHGASEPSRTASPQSPPQ